MAEIISEEGHVFSEEDALEYIKWKVNDLKQQGYSDEDILRFDDTNAWDCFAKVFIS